MGIEGMTDKQFDAYNRLLVSGLKCVEKMLGTDDTEGAKEELSGLIDILEKSLED